jgi:ribonuclease D
MVSETSPDAAPARFVDSRAALEETCAELSGAETLYLDTEFESSRDGTRLCLLQVSRGDTIHLVDTLRLTSLEPLAKAIGDPGSTWVLHAAQQDVPLLLGALRLRDGPRLFDTQVAWALLGPEYSVSLAYLVYRVLGIRSQKSHQADDWLRRPLPAAQLAYAASDIEHLPAIHRSLLERAAKLGREPAIYAASREIAHPSREPPPAMTLADFRNAWLLDADGQAGLRFLVRWYESLSPDERARAPEPKTLFSIASRLPESGADLARIKGVPRRFAAEQGERLVGQLMRATADAGAADFVPIEPEPYASFQEIRLEGWLNQARAEICAELSIAPELALPAKTMRKLRDELSANGGHVDQLAGSMTDWRAELVLPALIALAGKSAPPAAL